jgi:hypothetical protein
MNREGRLASTSRGSGGEVKFATFSEIRISEIFELS